MKIADTKASIESYIREYEWCRIHRIPFDYAKYGEVIIPALRDVLERIDKRYGADSSDNYEYPVNLFYDLGLDISEPITDDMKDGLEYTLCGLTERERGMLEKHYKDNRTYSDIGTDYGVTRERVRQVIVRALRKLRYYSRLNVIENGLEVIRERKRKKDEALERHRAAILELQTEISKLMENKELVKKIVQESNMMEDTAPEDIKKVTEVITEYRSDWGLGMEDITELELSVRSLNCLKRAGVRTLGDLAKLTKEKLMKMRNMGRKSVDEIIAMLKQYGIELQDV